MDLSKTKLKYIANNAFRDSSFDLIDLSGIPLEHVGDNSFYRSNNETKVKVSSNIWNKLIKGREIGIFGPNGKEIKRVDPN